MSKKIIPIADAQLRIIMQMLAHGRHTVREAVLAIADRHFLPTFSPQEVVDTFVRICVSLKGVAATDSDFQLITELLGYAIAFRYDLPRGFVVGARKRYVHDGLTWIASKFRAIEQAYANLDQTRAFIDLIEDTCMFKGGLNRLMDPKVNRGSQHRFVDNLFSGIAMFRRYGIKPSRFNLLRNQWWSARDVQDIPLAPGASVIAPGVLGTGSYVREGEHLIDYVVTADGELDLSLGHGIIPLRDVYAQSLVAGHYEVIRGATAMRLFDLTVSHLTVERANREVPILGRLIHYLPPGIQEMPAFIIPRLRMLEQEGATIDRELDEEMENDLRATRQRRNHRVEAHIRRLPKGRQPSQEAIELAQSHGFVLKAGETYVKKHRRGSGVALPDERGVSYRRHR